MLQRLWKNWPWDWRELTLTRLQSTAAPPTLLKSLLPGTALRLIYLPAPRIKAVVALLHSFLSALTVLCEKVDIVYFLDPANAPFIALLRAFGKKVVVKTDGLGWKRGKWGRIARRYYKFVEWACARTATALVTENPAMKEYYLSEYGADSGYIPYGAKNRSGLDESVFDVHALKPQGYARSGKDRAGEQSGLHNQ